MKGREYRFRTLFVLLAALAVGITTLLTYLGVAYAVQRSLSGAGTLADSAARGAAAAVLVSGAVALAVTLMLATQLGNAASSALARLRREIARLAEGGRVLDWQPHSVADVNLLAAAVARLARSAALKGNELAAEHAELADLIDAVSEGILQISADARVVRANRAAVELLRLPAGAGGQRIAAVVRQAELRNRAERAAAGENLPPFELQVDERRVLASAHPVTRGGAGGAVVVLVDLTQLRRLEDVRRDFVANASHELKTPLTSIRGYSETLLSDELPDELRRQFLETIRSNAERLQRVVDDLLDLSRIESGRWRPELEALDASEVALEAWGGCRAAAARKGVELHIDAPHAAAAIADRVALAQVFSNLFDNAIRYARSDTPLHLRIRPVSLGARTFLQLEVVDQGTGIPRDALPRIFERFYRLDPARSREAGGTGLGLAIVRHLVESMGGEIEAESELGRGTTIRFFLAAAE